MQNTQLGNDVGNHAGTSQRQGTLLLNLGVTITVAVNHSNQNILGTGNQVHSAAHAGTGLSGNHPVGQVTVLINLVGTQNSISHMTATDQAKGVKAAEAAAAYPQGTRG